MTGPRTIAWFIITPLAAEPTKEASQPAGPLKAFLAKTADLITALRCAFPINLTHYQGESPFQPSQLFEKTPVMMGNTNYGTLNELLANALVELSAVIEQGDLREDSSELLKIVCLLSDAQRRLTSLSLAARVRERASDDSPRVLLPGN